MLKANQTPETKVTKMGNYTEALEAVIGSARLHLFSRTDNQHEFNRVDIDADKFPRLAGSREVYGAATVCGDVSPVRYNRDPAEGAGPTIGRPSGIAQRRRPPEMCW